MSKKLNKDIGGNVLMATGAFIASLLLSYNMFGIKGVGLIILLGFFTVKSLAGAIGLTAKVVLDAVGEMESE